ncbi:GNAT family N-acetyltransferase [Paenibacillus sp. GCM10027627]
MSLNDAESISGWRYDPPYDVYNWPDWTDMVRDGYEFGDPALREQQYASITDHADELIGFVQFFPLQSVTRLGFGLRPDLCGLGLGVTFVMTIVSEAIGRTPDNEIDLEVLTWNDRAIRTYDRAGFQIEDTYMKPTPTGLKECHCMVYRERQL